MSIDEVKAKLLEFENNPNMITEGRYSPTATNWPDNILPFSEIHIAYLQKNKKTVKPADYLSNLQLMISR